MKISVVVPTFRRNESLASCLARLAPAVQDFAAQSYDVIVTDDAQDPTCKALLAASFPWARYVAGPARGPAANRNHGARLATGEWIAFTDDDCLPERSWLSAFAGAVAASHGISVFEGRTTADRPQRAFDEHAPLNDRGGCLWSCNILIARALFEKIGGFDERFPYAAMEDVDLRYRLDRLGERQVFVEGARVVHPYRTFADWSHLARHRKSMAIYLQIHPEERATYGAVYYFRAFALAIVREIPGRAFTYRGRGLGYAVARAFSCLRLAVESLAR